MSEHGLTEWELVFDRAKTRAGICHYTTRRIGLSRPLTELHDEAEVRETILHEIAHALVGPGHGHGPVWRRMAREIGCTGDTCLPADAPRLAGAWRGVCPQGHEITRHRRPMRVLLCGRCAADDSLGGLLDWTHRGGRVPMGERYDAELAEFLRQTGVAAAVGAAHRRPPRRRSGTGLRLPVGTPVELICRGRYGGARGRIVKHGRTRYHVSTAHGILAAPESAVRPL